MNITLSPEMSSIVICLYSPPSANSLFYEQLHDMLKECDGKKEILLVGDMVNIN